jgi:diaminopimelate epimerase
MRLWRAHGIGNDYLVLESGPRMTPELAIAICDRHRGVGGDGVLEPFDTDRADLGVRIWNPDGSIAEKSGNGLRIFAQWAVRVGGPSQMSVWTGHEHVTCDVQRDQISVAMGMARFDPAQVPVVADAVVLGDVWDVDGAALRVHAVGVGNPHCVVFFEDEDLDALPWHRWGEALENHPRFPNRTNVQFAQVTGPGEVAIRVWERGAGPTLASGSSSCAVAAAAVRTGRLPHGRVLVRMQGGDLVVIVHHDWQLTLIGPVQGVGTIEVDPDWLSVSSP